MNHREVLIQYLKSKVEACDWHAVSDAANDLRVLEARQATAGPTESNALTSESSGGYISVDRREAPNANASIIRKMSLPSPEEPQSTDPGDYRLKRSALGVPGIRLCEIRNQTLKRNVAEYEAAIRRGETVHPGALEDIEAAKVYLAYSREVNDEVAK